MKRISVVLVWVVLGVLLAASVALAAPDINGCSGQNSRVEDCTTGPSDTPNGFGAVTSERSSTLHDTGEHASNPLNTEEEAKLDPQDVDRDTPRKGVGNVARTDGFLADPAEIEDPGTRPGDHACLIGVLDGLPDTSCTADPGLPGHPGGQS